ncbi:glycosyl hydrolase, partial [Escherichia coli]|uniref:glycosyl hydrolase n=1 Tax=Escherichia coli TaxID=562 RepID=UPI0005C6BF0E
MISKVLAIRLAWEMNGGWYYYCVPAQGTMVDFVAAFRHVAQLFKAAGLDIHWCPNIGYGQNATPDYYPGDDVVDYVGLDVYCKRFQAIKAGAGTDDDKMWRLDMLGYGKTYVEGATNFGLTWLGEFGLAHGKPIIFLSLTHHLRFPPP